MLARALVAQVDELARTAEPLPDGWWFAETTGAAAGPSGHDGPAGPSRYDGHTGPSGYDGPTGPSGFDPTGVQR